MCNMCNVRRAPQRAVERVTAFGVMDSIYRTSGHNIIPRPRLTSTIKSIAVCVLFYGVVVGTLAVGAAMAG